MTGFYLKTVFILLLFLSASCSIHPFKTSLNKRKDRTIHKADTTKKDISEHQYQSELARLGTDLKRLNRLSSELASLQTEMFRMRENSSIWTLEYFPPEEHDKIENMLFRYLMIRRTLWDIINYYKDYRSHFRTPELQTKGFIIGYSAGLHLASYSSQLVNIFINEPSGKRKLNEAFPRSEIPPGTYDMLLSSVTSTGHMEAIKVAWILFCNEKKDRSSTLFKIYQSASEYRILIDRIESDYKDTEDRIMNILKEESLLFPKTVNRLKHTVLLDLADKLKKELNDNLYAIRGLLFTNVSGIKIPLVRSLKFSADQKKNIHALLEPGDIILTYTSGYMSNIFLPGSFKHGITYVGGISERRKTGLADSPSDLIKGIDIDKLEADFSTEFTESGMPADVIEAVAEGVILNSLDHLLDTHINRMVILRPRLSMTNRKEALTIVFSLLGNNYDFKFDFNDGTYQCCTEVIYRALNSRGAFNFSLVKRMGALTLSADDILRYYLSRSRDSFDLILYAEKNRLSGGNRAKIYKGDDGLRHISKIMSSVRN